MAITAAIRQDIMELAVLTNNAAPGTTLLAELVTMSNSGKSLLEITEHLVARSSFTATYPTHQTAAEFGTEWIGNILPEASAALKTECVAIVEAHINGGGSVASLILAVQEFMSAASESDANLGTHIANFNHKVEVATYHTITSEAAAEWTIPSTVTSVESTVATGKGDVDTALAPAATPVATYSLAADSSTVSEGGDTTFTLTTTNVAVGTKYTYTITGISSSDLSSGSLSGLAEIDTDGKATITVGLANDATTEGAETMTLSVAGQTAAVAITDSSTTPVPTTYTLSVSGGSVDEGNSGQANLTYTLSLDKAAEADVIVNYETVSGGTATAGTDYDAASGAVTFSAGQQNATVTVKVNGDTTFESDETVTTTFTGSSLTASVSSVSATISNDDTDPDTVAQAKTLTVGTDSFTTGSAADTFDGSTAGSLDTVDSIDGGAGSDTLTATIGNESVRPTISNVETIKLTATGALTIDTRDISGATNYNNESSSADLILNFLSSVPTVTLNTIVDDVTLNFVDAALSGSSDSMTINLNNVTLAGGEAITVTDAGGSNTLETIVINSASLASSIANLTTTAVGTTAVTVTGDADLTLSAVDAAVATLTSTAFTGDLTATLGNTTGVTANTGSGVDQLTGGTTAADTFSLGAGNDTLNIATANLTSVDTINGGDGTDTIAMSNASTVVDADFTLVTNTETLSYGTNNITLTLGSASSASGLTTITDGTGNLTASVGAGHTGNLTFTLSTGTDSINATVAANDLYTGALTVNTAGASITGADTITGGTGSDNLNVTGTLSNAGATVVTNFETITANDTTTAVSITIDELTVADGATLHVDGSSLTTAALTANLADDSNGINTVTGGGAGDSITGSGSDQGDTLNGGAGNDTFTFATANFTSIDTIDGGDGTDIITFSNAETVEDADFTNVTNVETYTGFAGASTIVLGPLAAAAGIVTVNTGGTAASTVTIPATHNADLTVVSQVAGETIAAAATYANKLTVRSTVDLQTTDTITGGAGTEDTFILTADGTDLATTDLDTVTLFENVDLEFNGDIGIASDTLMIATGASMTWTASGQTTGAVTLDLSDETDTTSSQTVSMGGTGAHIVTLGSGTDSYTYTYSGTGTHGVQTVTATAGTNTITTLDAADIITLGTGVDTVNTGAGNDTINTATANLVSTDTIDAGAGTDTLTFSDATATATVVDADFTNIDNIETVTLNAGNDTITLGAASSASGFTTLNILAGTNSVTVGSGHTANLTIAATSGTDTIDASAYTGALTVQVQAAELNGDTITGGTGSDTLSVTTAATLAANDFDTVTLFETIDIAVNGAISVTSDTLQIATGGTLAWTASGQTTGAVTLVLSDETDTTSAQTVTFGGTGAHIVTLGSGNDTYTYNYSGTGTHGVQTIVGTAGNNTITTLDAADIITLGSGVDTVNTGAGNDTINTATANLVSTDTIDGGTGTDTLVFSDATATATVVDADFTNIDNVETVTLNAGNDTITLGAASTAAGVATLNILAGTNSVTVGSGHTANLTVAMTSGTDTIDASAYTGALTVTVTDSNVAATDTLTGGTATDTLTITGSGNALTAAEMANITLFEAITMANNNTQVMTTNDANVVAGGTMTVTATALTNTVFNFNGSGETDGAFTITTGGSAAHIIVLGNGSDTYTSTNTAGVNTVTATAGNNTITTAAGADIITLGSGSDTVSSGAAADTILTTTANLNLNDTIDGGAGTDILQLTTDGSTVIDADFTNIDNVETLTTTADAQLTSATIGALAAAAGLTTVTFADTTAADTLVVAAGFTNNLTVNLPTDATAANTITATNYTGVLTVAADATDLDSNASTITGGTGTADELQVTGSASLTAILTASMTGIEKITAVGTAGSFSLTTADASIASGKSLTIDTTAGDNDAFTINAALEADGTVTVNGDGSGAYIVTLGAGADTYSNATGSGVHTIVGTGGANTITTGTGADIVTPGTGVDSLTGGTGANVVTFTATNQLVANSVVISDWTTGTYEIDFDISGTLDSGADLIDLSDASSATANDGGVEVITGAFDLGTADATDSIIVVNLTAGIASSDALETALEYGGDLQLTADGAIGVGDRFLVVYDDTVSTYIAMVTNNTAIADDGWFGAGTLTAVNLVKLTGIADATAVIAAEIDFS